MRHPSFAPSLPPAACQMRIGGLCAGEHFRKVPRERGLTELRSAFQRCGGLASGDELAGLVRPHWDQAVSTVARWIVTRSVLAVSWQAQTLLPLFQFEAPTMLLRGCMPAVLAELAPVYDEWDLALWFAEPNTWLDGAVPAELVARRPAAVLEAARADRFVARG